jgi:hypothetical protein
MLWRSSILCRDQPVSAIRLGEYVFAVQLLVVRMVSVPCSNVTNSKAIFTSFPLLLTIYCWSLGDLDPLYLSRTRHTFRIHSEGIRKPPDDQRSKVSEAVQLTERLSVNDGV